MIKINGINKGIVIDHIKPGLGYKIFKELRLHEADYTTALIRNVQSNKLGKKDLIKIDNVIDLDLTILGIIDPDLTITIIEEGIIKEKIKLTLPDRVKGILTCKNPRCVSTLENIDITFKLVNKETKQYRCEYCDAIAKL